MIIISIPAGGAGAAGIPSKAILLWPLLFDLVTYPQLTGYFLCDGANGTPDMRDYIPRGTPVAGVVLATTGVNTHTHTHTASLTKQFLNVCIEDPDTPVLEDVTFIHGVVDPASNLPKVRNMNFIQKA